MTDPLERIENKIDKLDSRLDAVDVTLAKQHECLAEHVRRTNLLEEDVAPIKAHVAMVTGAVKLITIAAAVGAGIEGIVSLLTFLRK